MKNSKKLSVKTLCFLSLFTALICIGAFIKIPFAIPVTLQLMFTHTAALTLGRKSAFSVLAYILMGLVGLPVFSSGGGISAVFSLTFGFNIGFLIGAFFAGAIAEKSKSIRSLVLASGINMLCVYVCGALYFWLLQNLYFTAPTSIGYALYACVLPFIIPDAVKCAVSIILSKKVKH